MNTEQKKWMEIAEAFLTSRDDVNQKQYYIASDGICYAVDEVWDYDSPLHIEKIINKCNPRGGGLWWPTYGKNAWTRQCDLERGLLVCFIATMPKDIYREFAE